MDNRSMATAIPEIRQEWTFAELESHLGVSGDRIRLFPPPGLAAEEHVLEAHDRFGKLCELIDGVLVEKVVGQYEASIAGWVITFLNQYLMHNPIGKTYAPDGPMRVLPGQVRMPDVSFIRAERYPQGKSPRAGILPFPPDLAIEILSAGNTAKEMQRKPRDYFAGGTRLVWHIDPESQSATVYTSPLDEIVVPPSGTLDGGYILPGFSLSLAELFDRVGPRED